MRSTGARSRGMPSRLGMARQSHIALTSSTSGFRQRERNVSLAYRSKFDDIVAMTAEYERSLSVQSFINFLMLFASAVLCIRELHVLSLTSWVGAGVDACQSVAVLAAALVLDQRQICPNRRDCCFRFPATNEVARIN